jgi:3-isopropylmalate/(R)-2-methylmalate dehydratase small subunit
MDAFTTVTGPAAPLLVANIDTDVIIRVERMTTTEPAALAPYAFEALRYTSEGRENSSFVLNQPMFRNAPILVAGANFGCGSSREPAVWALGGLGIRCIIAVSFGDIFRANCLTNGLLGVTLPPSEIAALAEISARGSNVTVDLPAQEVRAESGTWHFEISRYRKAVLLQGADDIQLALGYAPVIAGWERADRQRRPWAWSAESAPRQ